MAHARQMRYTRSYAHSGLSSAGNSRRLPLSSGKSLHYRELHLWTSWPRVTWRVFSQADIDILDPISIVRSVSFATSAYLYEYPLMDSHSRRVGDESLPEERSLSPHWSGLNLRMKPSSCIENTNAASRTSYSERDLEFKFQAFFHPFPFSFQLSVHDGSRLVAVSHLAVTENALSTIYCYYDDSYTRESLGTYAISKEIEIGRERGASFLYLGYYVAENRHMSYKGRFHPSQVRTTQI